jgi:Glycosyl hydrolase catalytic core
MSLLKGIGLGVDTQLEVTQLASLKADWHYGWSSQYRLAPPANFIPMVWGAGDVDLAIAKVISELPQTKSKHLLGFNEPDHAEQSKMTTGTALAAWPKLEATGLRLGSPATVKPDAWWMNTFMEKALDSGARIDFAATHIYQSPDATAFFRKLRELYERWGLPIWVTETAVADWDATTVASNSYSRSRVEGYMRDIFTGMAELDYVERAAWKTRAATDPQMCSSALFHTDGRLTSTGLLYASL